MTNNTRMPQFVNELGLIQTEITNAISDLQGATTSLSNQLTQGGIGIPSQQQFQSSFENACVPFKTDISLAQSQLQSLQGLLQAQFAQLQQIGNLDPNVSTFVNQFTQLSNGIQNVQSQLNQVTSDLSNAETTLTGQLSKVTSSLQGLLQSFVGQLSTDLSALTNPLSVTIGNPPSNTDINTLISEMTTINGLTTTLESDLQNQSVTVIIQFIEGMKPFLQMIQTLQASLQQELTSVQSQMQSVMTQFIQLVGQVQSSTNTSINSLTQKLMQLQAPFSNISVQMSQAQNDLGGTFLSTQNLMQSRVPLNSISQITNQLMIHVSAIRKHMQIINNDLQTINCPPPPPPVTDATLAQHNASLQGSNDTLNKENNELQDKVIQLTSSISSLQSQASSSQSQQQSLQSQLTASQNQNTQTSQSQQWWMWASIITWVSVVSIIGVGIYLMLTPKSTAKPEVSISNTINTSGNSNNGSGSTTPSKSPKKS